MSAFLPITYYIFASFLLSLTLTYMFMKYALYKGVIDVPNHRSSHSTPTPRGAGVSVVLVFLALFLLLSFRIEIRTEYILSLILGSGIVALIGFWDDHNHIPARWRFLAHFIAAMLSLIILPALPHLPFFGVDIDLSVFGFLFYGITLVWLLNLYNFMDGIDGIASVQAITMLLGAAIIIGDRQWSWLLILMGASVAGFLVWNWAPAKVFMGDSCSGYLGFTLGLLAIITSNEGIISIWSWLILYSVFVVDATVTLFRRMVDGQVWYEAHRSHAYQICSRKLRSHRKVTLSVLLVNAFWLFPIAWCASEWAYIAPLLTVIAVAPLIIFALLVGAGKVEVEAN